MDKDTTAKLESLGFSAYDGRDPKITKTHDKWRKRHVRQHPATGKKRYVFSEVLFVCPSPDDTIYAVSDCCPNDREAIVADLRRVGFRVEVFSTYFTPSRGYNLYEECQAISYPDVPKDFRGLRSDTWVAINRPCGCDGKVVVMAPTGYGHEAWSQ